MPPPKIQNKVGQQSVEIMFEPNDKDFWRAIILYGSNQSTYKMGLGNLLIKYADDNLEKITLDELAEDFFELYQNRIKNGKPQSKRTTTGDLQKGVTYVEQEITSVESNGTNKQKSLDKIRKRALEEMVLKRFNTLFQRQIPKPFYTVSSTHLILSDNLRTLFSDKQNSVMSTEVDSRWDLLEFGFFNLKNEDSVEIEETLEFVIQKKKRSQISRLKPILNGYQIGKCFYCHEDLYDPIHVDHLIPRTAIHHDEIWNLVLSHEHCNKYKLASLPPKHFVQKLINRNESVLKSDLPLREELIKVLGMTPKERSDKVWSQYLIAKEKGLAVWGGSETFNPAKDDLFRGLIQFYNKTYWSRKFDKIS